jgi:putative transposase
MNRYPKLQHNKIYHIFNRGNNSEDIFRFNEDYRHFLLLYEKYIEPVAETFSWCLLKNHFHILVRIKAEDEIGYLHPFYTSGFEDSGKKVKNTKAELKWQSLSRDELEKFPGILKEHLKQPVPFRQFSHLFNSYSKYVNAKYKRTGSLFEKNFRRICVENTVYFKNLVIYIHKNPQIHGIIENFKHYPWSSYRSVISLKPTMLNRKAVIGWFDDEASFVEIHSSQSSISLENRFRLEF